MRTVTVQFVGREALAGADYYTQERKVADGRLRQFRPVSHREWLAIERRVHAGRTLRRKPVNPCGHAAPPARLADGRLVSEAFGSTAP